MNINKEFVFSGSPHFRQCHASTLALLPGGELLCAWFAGTREGAEDVAIWGATRRRGVWSAPRLIADTPGIPLWNPVLFNPVGPPSRRIRLYYRVGPTIPEWKSFVVTSSDDGETWSCPTPLPDGCLGPIKNKPIQVSDGAWLAGSSVETADEWSCVIERTRDLGRSWQRSPKLSIGKRPLGIIQPTLWESQPGCVHALLRSRGTGRIYRTDSADGGRRWSTPYALDVPHNNSGIDLVKLRSAPPGTVGGADGLLLLACNPTTEGRTPLSLLWSQDNGSTWTHLVTLEDDPGEFSYPAIISTPGGFAVSYTYNRTAIRVATWDTQLST